MATTKTGVKALRICTKETVRNMSAEPKEKIEIGTNSTRRQQNDVSGYAVAQQMSGPLPHWESGRLLFEHTEWLTAGIAEAERRRRRSADDHHVLRVESPCEGLSVL